MKPQKKIMFFRLLLLFILIPLADLVLLLIASKYLTWQVTLLLVIVTGVVGAWLARRQWQSLILRLQTRHRPATLSEVLSDGAMILFAGALLITPGFITDLLGLSLLSPKFRAWYRRFLAQRMSDWLQIRVFTSFDYEEEGVVEGRARPASSPPGNRLRSSNDALSDRDRETW